MRAALTALICVAFAAPALAEGPPETPETRHVMFVGNNWDGTADIIDMKSFQPLGRINMIPDREERMAEIMMDPVDYGFFLGIRQLVGEGNDQFVDDMFTTHDGRLVVASRPSFADVVGLDLATKQIVWRFPMEGQRSDHMGVSPDGSKVLVSDSTANKVHELDMVTGAKTGEFPSGDSPHESNYSRDGKRIYHASIGRVYTPTDRSELGPVRDSTKGERYFQIVDGDSLAILKRWDMGEKLDEAGHEEMESAVRPMALAPDEKQVYLQISFHHGFVEFDLEQEKVLRVAELPVSEEAQGLQREEYLLDSAHHGLAMNDAGTKLCVAGTMSDYAAIVERSDFSHEIFQIGEKPYWATNDATGTRCWLSSSGDDHVAILDYESEREIARVPVGDHPQRVRVGVIRRELVGDLPRPTYPALRPRVFHKPSRRGVGVWRDRINIGCGAGIELRSCAVRLRVNKRTIGSGTRTSPGRRSVVARVRLNRSGRALLRRRPRGFNVTIVARATDAVGRAKTTTKRVRLRRGTRPR
jgi:hypothetical protein